MIFKLDFQDSFRNSCDVFVFFLLSIYRAQVNQSYKSWMRIVVVYQLIRLVKQLKDAIITVNYQTLTQTKVDIRFPDHTYCNVCVVLYGSSLSTSTSLATPCFSSHPESSCIFRCSSPASKIFMLISYTIQVGKLYHHYFKIMAPICSHSLVS